MRRFPYVLVLLATAVALRGEIFLRWNQSGYAAAQPKVLIALSDADLAGRAWTVTHGGAVVARGAFGPSATGAGDHTPFAFNHAADFSALTAPGDYEFATAGRRRRSSGSPPRPTRGCSRCRCGTCG